MIWLYIGSPLAGFVRYSCLYCSCVCLNQCVTGKLNPDFSSHWFWWLYSFSTSLMYFSTISWCMVPCCSGLLKYHICYSLCVMWSFLTLQVVRSRNLWSPIWNFVWNLLRVLWGPLQNLWSPFQQVSAQWNLSTCTNSSWKLIPRNNSNTFAI